MKFIVTECTTGYKQSVTRECVDRIKGKFYMNTLIKKVEETGEPIELNFESHYDLMITKE